MKDEINVQTYRKRIMILKGICRTQEFPEQLICIQADTSIEIMTRSLLLHWPSCIFKTVYMVHTSINQQPILIALNNIQNLNKLLLADGNLNKC